jgi:hypothetical protein
VGCNAAAGGAGAAAGDDADAAQVRESCMASEI